MANLVYPNRQPVPGNMSDYNPDQPTGPIDYLMMRRMSVKKGSEPPKGFFYNTAGGKYSGLQPNNVAVYLACPPQLKAAYAAHYEKVAFGTVGVGVGEALAAGQTLSKSDAATILQKTAGDAMPELALSAITDVTKAASNLAGSDFSGNKNDLLAVSQGKIFNPYEEQIFRGTGFRTFNFQFKLVARNEKEADDIGRIIGYLKEGMLPHMGGPDTAASGGNTSNAAQRGRYLYVPDKFKLEFVRMDPTKNKLQKLPHFKFMECVLESMDVTYTPDGQYAAFKYADTAPNKLKVPAGILSLQFKETAYITKELAGQGY